MSAERSRAIRSRWSTCSRMISRLRQADGGGTLRHPQRVAGHDVLPPEARLHDPAAAVADEAEPLGERVVIRDDAAAGIRAHRLLPVERKRGRVAERPAGRPW